MAERDSKGLFQKGNTVCKKREKKPSIFQEARTVSKEGVAQSVINLFEKTYAQYKEDTRDESKINTFEFVLSRAIAMNNAKFVQWAIEWVGGRALQMSINKLESTPIREIVRPDGTVVRYQVKTNENEVVPADCIEEPNELPEN